MKKIASHGLILLFALSVVFHVLVLCSVIPFTIVGGGRITTQEEMYGVETTVLALNLLFLLISLLVTGYIKWKFSPRILTAALWVMVVVFLLNTVGNFFSNSYLEKLIFTPITLVLAVFAAILALDRNSQQPEKTNQLKFSHRQIKR
ncbi:hypothetical protein ACD591_14755 [Rufibacter glacialis]|uniref:DUF4293 family protein n=1 Tax=Rufibacter glacialis TaxID=1259555 RepID=A0A5M8QR93_9BACT|nr:hypothetical protein [Rufibacter glacialis]KAA6437778.1 hypothetical protein FOE74_04570 [Rufibacter glacialis]GGK56367.1 hypothetical protein GCM10011405_00600 [Rufibacter glacialis]